MRVIGYFGVHAAAVSALALIAAQGRADVLHVPAQYATIQAAIDAAIPGDTVLVADGNWQGFQCSKSITVRSENGPAACIIDAWSPYEGGHVELTGEASPEVRGFTISDGGLGVRIHNGSQATLRACTISRMWHNFQGAGVQVYGSNSSATLIDCIIRDNRAGIWGVWEGLAGGMLISQSYVTMIGCIVENNRTEDGLAITHAGPIHGGGSGGGIVAFGGSLTLIDTIIRNNRAGNGGSDPGCDPMGFSGAGTDGGSGGGLILSDTDAVLINVLITGNSAGSGGAGGDCPPREGGDGGDGGGLVISGGSTLLINCTIAGNSAGGRGTGPAGVGEPGRGGGIFAVDATLEVHNSILWGNIAPEFGPYEAQLVAPAASTFTHSCIMGLPAGFDLRGNFDLDPRFLGPPGDYRPAPNSPCIDAGDNTRIPSGITADLAGEPRFHHDPGSVNVGIGVPPVADVGAYEFQGVSCYADCNTSGMLNVDDFTCFIDRFASGDPRANCDESAVQPILNVDDFLCFIDRFAAGCP